MADLRIADAPEIALENITGNEKIPTGGYGNSAVTINILGQFAKNTLSLATEEYVSNALGQKENKITLTGLNLTPTSTLVEIPQTNNSVLNTIHQDLLNRMEWIKDNTTVITDHQTLTNRAAFNTHPSSSISHNGTSNVSIEIEELKNDILTINTTTIPELQNDIIGKQDVIVNDVNLSASSVFGYVPSTNNSALNNSLQSLVNRDKFINDNIKTGLPPLFDSSFSTEIGGYPLNARIMLDNGDIVKSIVPNNTNNPNSDMTGWVKTNSASQIFDESGLSQQEWNNGVESIADLLAIQSPKDGLRLYVKSYYTPNFTLAQPYKGGGVFIYNASKSSINDGITIFNGWTRSDLTYYVTPEMAGAYSDGVNYDSDACQIAVNYAHENSLQVFFQSESYLFDKTVNLLTGTNYKEQGSIVRGLGKAKTFVRSIQNVDCFNVTNKNSSHPTFAPNFELTDMSFEQTGVASKTSIAIKTTDNLNSCVIRNVSFFNMKQALKMPHQFYISSIHNLHAQNCTYGYELGLEGTTLDIGTMFVTGGGGEPDSFAYKIRSGYSTIGALACDNFDGQAYSFAWGEYHISALGAEKLKPTSSGVNFSFNQCRFNVVNIKLVDVNELTASSLIISAGDSIGTIKSVTVANSDPTSPATLFRSYSSNVDLGAYKGTTTFAKPVYPDQSNSFGVTVGAFQHQRGGYRPTIGLRYNSIVDYLTPTENPCKQSFIFDIYGSGFGKSGYSGDQDWLWRPAPLVGDWGIQRRPDLFGIAATVALVEGGNNRDRTQDQLGVVPLIVVSKPTTPITGCIFVDRTTKKVEMYIGNEWVLLN